MAAHSGTIQAEGFLAHMALSPAIDGFAANAFAPTSFMAAETAINGSHADVLIAQPVDDHDGMINPDFADLWYDHIHIIPNRINVGNLTSQQVRPIEIFNGYFTAKQMTAVAGTDVSGTLFNPALPLDFAPLESHIVNLEILTTGAPNFNGFYAITFAGLGDLFLFVQGKRVLAIPFQHNWSDKDGGSIIERLAYRTSILPSEGGIEQAIMWRKYPRRTLEYKLLLASSHTNGARLRALFHSLMFGWQHRTFAVPIWTDATRLQVQANAGSNVITVPTSFFDYDIGNYVMLWQNEETYELVEIQSMTGTTITAAVNLLNTWPAHRTVVMPARLAVVQPEISGTKHTVDLDSVPMTFEVLPQAYSTNRLVAGARTLYRGLHVLLTKNNYADNNTFNISRPMVRNDAEIGYFSIDAIHPAPQTMQSFGFVNRHHIDAADLFAWLDSRKGRYGAFWLPTWSHDMQVTQDVGSGANAFIIQSINYSALCMIDGVPAYSRRDVMVQMKDGTRYFRRITGAVDNEDGTETISIDTSFGVILQASQIDRVCFLIPSRQEADAIELAWLSGNVSRMNLNFSDLFDPTI